ncbi:histidine kinase [Algicella marina]|uniref:histidine kinase n=1 Tax=Algicella marina TaxID=2683284 RepID=UPI001379CDE9|nr:histidine kinase [Algicella marina]
MFRRITLKWQVVLCIGLVQLAALAVCATILVSNARDAVRVEVAAGERSARALILATLGSALQDAPPGEVMVRLADILVQPRHVQLALVSARDGVLSVREIGDDVNDTMVPEWFRNLVMPALRETRIPVRADGTEYGYVAMTTSPEDEIAEVWQDVASLFWIFALAALISAVLLALLVAHALSPLQRLRTAMDQLRQGDFSARISGREGADLLPIFDGFDGLSRSLQAAEQERATLSRRIVELGDAERRNIAMELHDEFGPCLFGLKVKSSSIARAARTRGDAGLTEDADAIMSIVSQIQASNTRLLTTLRPMAIGQLPLADALRDLFDAFRTTHPRVDWRVHLPEDLPETQEIFDLTVYRFFQEAATNALRHGNPQRVEAKVEHVATGTTAMLRLSMEDDGIGIEHTSSEGRGLTAMRDRIGAIGGQLSIGSTDIGGTRLVVALPIGTVAIASPPMRAVT